MKFCIATVDIYIRINIDLVKNSLRKKITNKNIKNKQTTIASLTTTKLKKKKKRKKSSCNKKIVMT